MLDQTNLINEGFGESTMEDLAALRKALSIGYTDPPTSGPDALRVESLEATLKLLTYQQQNIKFWNMIPKEDAFSTIEEYNRLSAYGSDGGGFTPAGALPEEDDTTYSRENQRVKYMGTTRSVAHPSTLIRTVPADLIAQETQNGALWLMGKANTGLYYGDSDAIPMEWNGVTKQIIDGGGTVIDMAGAPLAQADLENGAQIIVDNFGQPSQMLGNSKIFTDFSKIHYGNQRFAAPNVASGYAGTPLTGFNSISGQIAFQPDTFVKRGSVVPTAATSTKAPNAPTISVGSSSGTGSSFVTADAGNYKYQATAVNLYGESAPCTISGAESVVAGESVVVTITDGGGANQATAYKIYRTEKDGTTTYYVGFITARTKVGSLYQATTNYTDTNAYRPRTFIALMLDMSQQALTFKQLAPMMKMNLATISPAIRWMQLLYGTPIVYAPMKHVVYKNIGVTA